MAEAMTTLGGGKKKKRRKKTRKPVKRSGGRRAKRRAKRAAQKRSVIVSKFGIQTKIDPETDKETSADAQEQSEEAGKDENQEGENEEKDEERKDDEEGDEGEKDGNENDDENEPDGNKQDQKEEKDKAADKAKETEKKGKKAAKKATKQAVQQAARAVVAFLGPYLWPILIILILLAILLIIMYGSATLSFAGGQTGGTAKEETDLSNPEHIATIKKIESYTKQSSQCGKRLEFADPEDLKMIKNGEIDYRVLIAIKTLTAKNNHLKISHIAHLMNVIPANTIETHSDVENEYVDNLSAHKDGMAFDMVEINCVYEKCKCSKKCGCKKIPVKIAWQDKSSLPGIARDAGLNQVNDILGLPDGALDGHNPDETFESTGLAKLEQQFRVAKGTFEKAKNLEEFNQKYGQAEIEKAFRLPPGSLKDQDSLTAYASESGRKKMEKVLKLPKDSLQGSQPSQVEKNTGEKSAEEELAIPNDLLTKDPKAAYKYLEDLDLSDKEKQSIEQKLGWPNGTVNRLMADLKQGDTAGVNSTLTSVGKDVLEQAIGLNKGELDESGSAPFSPEQGKEKDAKNGLPEGTLTNFVIALKNGEGVNDAMVSVGGKDLDEGMGLYPGSIKSIISGTKTPIEVLDESEKYGSYSNSYLASKLNITENEARSLKNTILSGNDVSPVATSIGTNKIENQFNLDSGSLKRLINGNITPEEFLKINSGPLKTKAEALGIPRQTINQLFSGDVSGAAITYGQQEIADTFGIDINQYLSWVESGNIEALIQNKVIQVISKVLEIDPGIIGGILMGDVSPEALISLGFSMLYGGPLGGIFGGVFGGVFGGNCSTSCYQSEAKNNVRKVIGQLLNLGEGYYPTQIIIYDKADVAHFKSRIDEIYGDPRPINYGLFARDEMFSHIHVGY